MWWAPKVDTQDEVSGVIFRGPLVPKKPNTVHGQSLSTGTVFLYRRTTEACVTGRSDLIEVT